MRHVVVITLITLAMCTTFVAADSPPPQRLADSVRGLRADAGPTAIVKLQRSSQAARLVRVSPGSFTLAGSTTEERARAFLTRHGAAFGVDDAGRNLVQSRHVSDHLGRDYVAFQQRHRGVPVFGSELRLHFDPSGELVTANGRLVPDIRIDSIEPTVQSGAAEHTALAIVAKQTDTWDLSATAKQLVVFREGFVADRPGDDHLVWEVEVGNGHQVREFLYIDAHTGQLVDQMTGIKHINRVVYHRTLSNTLWTEGDALPFTGLGDAGDQEVNNLVDFALDTYQVFQNMSGGAFLSFNGNDATMRSIYEDQNLSCPNAWWTGSFTGFCANMTSDDVVAHEWTHAYTDYTHDLVYQWQPGALNEAYSDIFGEVVDLLNGAGTDSGDELRTDGACSALLGGDRPHLMIEQPPGLSGELEVGDAAFNPLPPWSVQGEVEMVNDGEAAPADGCQPLVGFTPGNIALIRFGGCLFRPAAENASAAGAVGVIFINSGNDSVITMPGSGERLDIPSVMVGKTAGAAIEAALDEGVIVNLQSVADGSVRWLMGEDTSFSGLRDMWHPNCAGDPGKVTDSQYWCSTDDGGGVHTNSGVPNHAFALAVDGGSFNGHTVQSIGLTKAAHIWWRAMSVYQTRVSDFADHADLVELSCRDLVGESLFDLATGNVSGEVINDSDCDQVAEAMLATEMRAQPLQCNFALVLQPDAPELPRYPEELFSETFDSDPGQEWTVSNEGVDLEDYIPRDWAWTFDVPSGGDGGSFFATDDPMGGNCSFNDQSGVMHLDGPPISIPDGSLPVLVFDHYMASEPKGDGGNVRISVNGGPYELIPEDAFLFNPYNEVLDGPDRSNNPNAGEPAFSGVNAASFLRGSWGQSQVNLAGFARPGDTIRIRFDFSFDGCSGVDGWYLDNVVVRAGDAVIRGGGRRSP